MDSEEVKRSRRQGLTDLWYVVRFLTGAGLHLFMILCALSLTEHVFVFMEANPHLADPFSHTNSRFVHFLVAISVFAAGMAGASWVKSLYIRHVLPEAMDDLTKRILGKQ